MSLVDMFGSIGTQHGLSIETTIRKLLKASAPAADWRHALAARIVAGNTASSAEGESQALLDRELIKDTPSSTDRLRLTELQHHLNQGRIRTAVTTILDDLDVEDDESVEHMITRMERLARAEAIESAQAGYGKGMARSKKVEGWIRDLESNACELCQWWSRDGRVWPANHVMPTHPGCACAQEFVVRRADEIRDVTLKAYYASENRSVDREIAKVTNDGTTST